VVSEADPVLDIHHRMEGKGSETEQDL
jgi:hypothetical protein